MADILNQLLRSTRKESIVKRLSKECGGKWAYVGPGFWECDDGKRTVMRVGTGLAGDTYTSSEYYLYGDGIPMRLFL